MSGEPKPELEVPFERVVWDAEECAAYLGQSRGAFLKRTSGLPTFPQRCPMPGHPRWPAKAVMEWKAMKNKPTSLYRHYSAAGELLYVGISLSQLSRLRDHADRAAWFFDIATIKVEHYPTMAEALAAEAKAIQDERPRHNRRGRC